MCASLPDVTFIWKYEEPSTMADHLPNVHLSPWLPQNALLGKPSLVFKENPSQPIRDCQFS